jgi:class 3 adenylate cyclase/tetratricopeptide (TPR) repeat protein
VKVAASTAAAPARDPRAYTPRHLADRILQSQAVLEGERKQVTVLFADVKGSMELAEQLDPEEWHQILDRFFRILTEGVHRFEGTVNQYTGDGIMALFGAPIAHEDHAQRACYAALYMRDTLKSYADALRVTHGLNFSVRMGINSGDVVVGKIGDDLRMDYTAQGHTVGLAQRMEGLAEAGKALLAGATVDLVQGYFALRDLGAMKVKGVDAPVAVAELEGVGGMRTRLDRSRARGLSKFVGRDEEMGRLEAALERALQGDGQVVAVMAEAGSGKSRLCFEFLERCRARGIIVRSGTGVPHGRAVPLQPVLEFHREIFGIGPDDTDAQARQKIAGIVAQIAPEELPALGLLYDFMRVPDPAAPPPDLAPDVRQDEVIGLVGRLNAARSRREPALLVFEDLHWIDPETEAIVEGIVNAAAGTRTMGLFNFRPEYRAPWAGRTHYQQMALRPLDAAATAELVADWLGSHPSLSGFAELVSARTGGNPFFMEEVVQAAIDSGVLVGTRGHFRLTRSIETVEVPVSVQSLLAARIDRLDEASKQLLQTAAVIGADVPETLLRRVAGLDDDALRNGLRRLVQSEFLHEAALYPEREYAFKHPLTREVAYASLLRERRQAVHAAVAEALEALAGEAAGQRASLLAHHWEQAGRVLEAARWHTRAAARLGFRAGESISHWRKVTELLAGSREVPEALALLGQARARLVYAASRSGAEEGVVTALFEAARQELGDHDSSDLAFLIATYAAIRNGAGHTDEGQRLATEAVDMARRIGDPELLGAVLGVCLIVWTGSEFPAESRRLVEEIERLAATNPAIGASVLGYGARAHGLLSAIERARRLGQRAAEERGLESLRQFVGHSTNSMEQGVFHFSSAILRARRGDVDPALEHGRQALEWLMRSENQAVRSLGLFARGLGFFTAGRLDEALDHLEKAKNIGVDRGMLRQAGVAFTLPLLSETHARRGDVAAACDAAELGVELSREMGYRHAEAKNLVALAVALTLSGEADRAAAALTEAAELTTQIGARDLPPFVEEARAALARLRGDAASHERALREAARLHRENGEEWLAAQAEKKL